MGNRTAAILSVTVAVLACGVWPSHSAPPPPPQPAATNPPPRDAVATVNGQPISRESLARPLIEAYGLQTLLSLVQLELARQNAAKANLVVTPADVLAERQAILKGAFPDADERDYDNLLGQLLTTQKISKSQFEILLQTNAYLRKMAEPLCRDKISEENLHEAFGVMYGETVKVRDIQLPNALLAAQAKQRLDAGEDFARVAREMSTDVRTRGLGGELPAFSRNSTGFSETFKSVAFLLKDGEVSDIFSTDNVYHIIRLEKRNTPRLAKFDDVKDSIRRTLTDRLVVEAMKNLRRELGRQAIQSKAMQILDPELDAQFQQMIKEQEVQAKEETDARRDSITDRIRAATRAAAANNAGGERTPTTAPVPATQPGGAVAPPANSPAGTGANDRPPATKPGAAVPG